MMNDEQIRELLQSVKRIAVVGLSDKPWRPSFGVSEYMQSRGYEIIPVNPNVEETLGRHAYQRLEDVPGKIDIVNIFRGTELGLTEAWHALRIVNVVDGTNEILNRTIAQRLLKGDVEV